MQHYIFPAVLVKWASNRYKLPKLKREREFLVTPQLVDQTQTSGVVYSTPINHYQRLKQPFLVSAVLL